jgi:site-specific DNA-adenine methylase
LRTAVAQGLEPRQLFRPFVGGGGVAFAVEERLELRAELVVGRLERELHLDEGIASEQNVS